MGVFKNFMNKLRQAKKAADEATTDHVANAEIGMEDGKKQLTSIENQLHDLRAKARNAEKNRDSKQESVDKIKTLIDRQVKAAETAKGQALEQAKVNLGILINERKQAEQELLDAQTVVSTNTSAIQSVSKTRDEIKGKLRAGESKLAAQKAKLQAAKATQSIRSSVTTYEKNGWADKLDALDEKVQHEESKAEVSEEMSGEKSENRLASIESQLNSGPSTDDEIAALLAGSKKTSKK